LVAEGKLLFAFGNNKNVCDKKDFLVVKDERKEFFALAME